MATLVQSLGGKRSHKDLCLVLSDIAQGLFFKKELLLQAGCHINPATLLSKKVLMLNHSGDAAPRFPEGCHDDLIEPVRIGEETRSNCKAVVWRLWKLEIVIVGKTIYSHKKAM